MQSVKGIKIFIGIILLCACIGLGNASLLFEKSQSGGVVPCFVVSGCAQVQNSSYSHIGGVSLSLLGMIYYAFLICATLYVYLKFKKQNISFFAFYTQLHIWFVGVLFGFIFSLYLLFLQIFPIGAFCSSCLLSLIDMIIITACATIVWRRMKRAYLVRER